MEQSIRESGLVRREMEKVCKSGLQARGMMGFGRMTSSTVKVGLCTAMELCTVVNGSKGRAMGLESSSTMTEADMKANG